MRVTQIAVRTGMAFNTTETRFNVAGSDMKTTFFVLISNALFSELTDL